MQRRLKTLICGIALMAGMTSASAATMATLYKISTCECCIDRLSWQPIADIGKSRRIETAPGVRDRQVRVNLAAIFRSRR